MNLVLSCLLSETLPQNSRYQGKLLQSFSLLAGFVKYKRFFRMLIMFAMLAAPYMAYLAVSSFVYVSYFGLTAQEYSYYFAVNSAAAIIGPGLYLWLKKSFANRQIIIISFVTTTISGLLVLLAGSIGMALGTLPWANFIQGLAIIMLVSLGLGILIWKITPQNDQPTGKSYK